MGFKSVLAKKVSFDTPGMTLEGKINSHAMTGFDVNSYSMTLSTGEDVTFLGTAVLDKNLPQHEGEIIRITYKGEDKVSSGQGRVKLFDVEVYEEDDPEAPAPAPAPAPAASKKK